MIDQAKAVDVLTRLGWLAVKAITPEAIHTAFELFQRFNGIEATGSLDGATERTLVNRIFNGCGVPDIARSSAGRLCQWPKVEVAYFIHAVPSGIDANEAKECYRRAWVSWNAVCGLKAYEVDSVDKANVVMSTGRGRRSNFDGPSGTLAWSELPCENARQLQQRYDLDESWATSAPAGGRILLENVACHEIGHAIGLDHIAPSRGKALMNPVYSSSVPRPLNLDIEESRRRYGSPTATPAPSPTPSPVPTPGAKQKVVITIEGHALEMAVQGLKKQLIQGVE